MSKSIYLVTAGNYSDYTIVAAFENANKAAAFCKMKRKEPYWCDCRVEEYEKYDDNICEGDAKAYFLYHYNTRNSEFNREYVDREIVVSGDEEIKNWKIACLLPERDDEKAYKILQDKFAEWKAAEIERFFKQ